MKKEKCKKKRFFDEGRQLEEELRLTEAKFRALLDNISSGVAVYEAKNDGQDFIFVDFNRAAQRIEKIKKENLIGKSVLEVFPGVRDFGLFEVFQRVWKTGEPEYHPVSQYADERVIGWRKNYVYKLPSGEIVAIYDDVTESKDTEFALRMSEQCFHAIANYSYFWEIWVNPAGRPVWTNPAVQRVTGYSVKELMSMADYPLPLIYKEDRDRVSRAFRSALRGGSGREFEFRLLRKDETVAWVDVSWQPIYDEKGAFMGHRASVRDITDRKRAEEQIRRQNAVLNAINEVFQKALTCDSEEEVAYVCLDVAEKLTGSRFGFIGEVNQAGLFDTIAISDPGWDECKMPGSEATKLIKNMELRGIWSTALKNGKTQIINEPDTHPERVGVPEGHPAITRFLGIPLKQAGRTIGMIGLANKQSDYDVKDQEALQTLSVAFVEALMRKRAEKRA